VSSYYESGVAAETKLPFYSNIAVTIAASVVPSNYGLHEAAATVVQHSTRGETPMFSVGLTAKDIMSSPVVTVTDTMSLKEVSRLLLTRQISGAPVLDEKGLPVGVVTLKDVVRSSPRGGNGISTSVGEQYVLKPGRSKQDVIATMNSQGADGVHAVMTPYVYRVEEDTSVLEIARIMTLAHIHRLFVSEGNRISGVVSALDMLKCYAGLKAVAA